ncbi:hypothetical protein OCK74_12230 [Chitinophagaceae bacterium LB-8]|uniref:SH3 domain-containing protein n=1 Tax=Paraflavisolibacter caeni TaxID=2982496 RepID=A0A9X3B801_9BACT|nr:hypothetical protein [Paraflavisolibacter caeni]MCU7549890.1 hypothetical protein [Paraflavisolibacter caeni]
MIPEHNLIIPPPNQFTHEVVEDSPFYYSEPGASGTPVGALKSGTKVVLLVYDEGSYCRVADGQGLYVVVEYGRLRKL